MKHAASTIRISRHVRRHKAEVTKRIERGQVWLTIYRVRQGLLTEEGPVLPAGTCVLQTETDLHWMTKEYQVNIWTAGPLRLLMRPGVSLIETRRVSRAGDWL